MDSRLYVGNLPYSTTDDDLRSLFGQAGTVSEASVVRYTDSGRSKGFAFVEMGSADEAQKAINLFHGQDFGGRPLTVNIARPREERPRFEGERGGGGGGGGRRFDRPRGGDRYNDRRR